MLEGDIEISTVTILQSLIDKINDTLNDSPSQCSNESSCKSRKDVQTTHGICNDILSDVCNTSCNSIDIQGILDFVDNPSNGNGSPAAYEEVSNTTCLPNDNDNDAGYYDTLAKFIRELSDTNHDLIMSEQSLTNLKLSDISETEGRSITPSCSSDSSSIKQIVPFTMMKGNPFHLFSANTLDKATNFTHNFSTSNRSAVYYGKYPYSYGKVSHAPKDFSENSYLLHVLSYVNIVLPGIKYNSAMIHKYNDGNAFIPHHADNEDMIKDGSQIITISFGESRFIEFRDSETGSKICQKLSHGDVFVMDKSTQGQFTHSIPMDETKPCGMRLSITLRYISPPGSIVIPYSPLSSSPDFSISSVSHITESDISQSEQDLEETAQANEVLDNNSDNQTSASTTLYISDSMFRKLDESRLSSAIKFFHPRSNASHIHYNLKSDAKFKDIQKSFVLKVFILAGSNNIDDIY